MSKALKAALLRKKLAETDIMKALKADYPVGSPVKFCRRQRIRHALVTRHVPDQPSIWAGDWKIDANEIVGYNQ